MGRHRNGLWRFLRFDMDVYLRVYSVRSPGGNSPIRLTEKPRDLLPYVPGVLRFGVWEMVATAYTVWWESETLTYSVRKGDMTEEVDPDHGCVATRLRCVARLRPDAQPRRHPLLPRIRLQRTRRHHHRVAPRRTTRAA